MRGELQISAGTLIAFLLVLTRVAGVFTFIPMPWRQSAVNPVKAMCSLAITISLFPLWPRVDAIPGAGQMVMWVLAETANGVMLGLIVFLIAEVFALASQILGLQAGYTYASTIDPSTQADSGVMQVMFQLSAGTLFFVLGLDREVMRAFALSLQTQPPGTWMASGPAAEKVIHAGASLFAAGFKLALPVVAMLLIMDILLALMGRINAHLQLLSLAFPLKMLAALAILVLLAPVLPRVYSAFAGECFTLIRGIIAP